jgi:hypothetical protein
MYGVSSKKNGNITVLNKLFLQAAQKMKNAHLGVLKQKKLLMMLIKNNSYTINQ